MLVLSAFGGNFGFKIVPRKGANYSETEPTKVNVLSRRRECWSSPPWVPTLASVACLIGVVSLPDDVD